MSTTQAGATLTVACHWCSVGNPAGGHRSVVVWALAVLGASLLLGAGCRRQGAPAEAPGKSGATPSAVVTPGPVLKATAAAPKPGDPAAKPLSSWAESINSEGLVVGASETSEGVKRAFLWAPEDPKTGAGAHMEDLGEADGTQLGASEARGVNDEGLVVGWVSTPPGDQAFVWAPATRRMRLLPEAWPGACTSARAINRHGLVVGNSNMNPVLWDLAREPLVCEKLFEGGRPNDAIHGAWARDVSDRGEIVGWGRQLNHSHLGFRCAWDRGRDAPRSLPFDAADWNSPVAVNDHRDIAGYKDQDAVLWRMEEKELVRLPRLEGASRAWANGLNARPMVVGCCESEKSEKKLMQACEWHFAQGEVHYLSGWEVQALGGLGGPKSGSNAVAVNDRGQVVGKSETAPGSDVWHACLWERDAAGKWATRDLGTLP